MSTMQIWLSPTCQVELDEKGERAQLWHVHDRENEGPGHSWSLLATWDFDAPEGYEVGYFVMGWLDNILYGIGQACQLADPFFSSSDAYDRTIRGIRARVYF